MLWFLRLKAWIFEISGLQRCVLIPHESCLTSPTSLALTQHKPLEYSEIVLLLFWFYNYVILEHHDLFKLINEFLILTLNEWNKPAKFVSWNLTFKLYLACFCQCHGRSVLILSPKVKHGSLLIPDSSSMSNVTRFYSAR